MHAKNNDNNTPLGMFEDTFITGAKQNIDITHKGLQITYNCIKVLQKSNLDHNLSNKARHSY